MRCHAASSLAVTASRSVIFRNRGNSTTTRKPGIDSRRSLWILYQGTAGRSVRTMNRSFQKRFLFTRFRLKPMRKNCADSLDLCNILSTWNERVEWIKQGFCKLHYMNNSIYIYVPWANVIYCQYASQHDANREQIKEESP